MILRRSETQGRSPSRLPADELTVDVHTHSLMTLWEYELLVWTYVESVCLDDAPAGVFVARMCSDVMLMQEVPHGVQVFVCDL